MIGAAGTAGTAGKAGTTGTAGTAGKAGKAIFYARRKIMRSVLMATAEFAPFVKAGGLGDVAGVLPFELRKKGADVRVVMPLYAFLPAELTDGMTLIRETQITLGWRRLYCGIYAADYKGLPMYFIDNKDYFGGDRLYYDMDTDIERFSYFSAGVLNALPYMDFEPDIIHCHDWHTSLIPVLLQAHFKKQTYYGALKTVLTVHNMKFQGCCNKYKLFDILGVNDGSPVAQSLSYGHDTANCFKGGLSVADKLTTVSETYANEIRGSYFGEGLGWLMNWRGHDLVGILNGIDMQSYDPSGDGAIACKFSVRDAARGKKANKAALQCEFGLEADAARPVIAVVSRLSAQKGLDLIMHAFDGIMNSACVVYENSVIAADITEGAAKNSCDVDAADGTANETIDTCAANAAAAGDCAAGGAKDGCAEGVDGCAPDAGSIKYPQFVLLGVGEKVYEDFFRQKQEQYPGTVSVRMAFSDALARMIYAGADFFLMPSIFEPCGISQMIAMRYGALPIVRETGGLADTVRSYNEETGEGTGYSFSNENADDMLYTVRRALGIYGGGAGYAGVHDKIVASAMSGDFSWDKSVEKYINLYENM